MTAPKPEASAKAPWTKTIVGLALVRADAAGAKIAASAAANNSTRTSRRGMADSLGDGGEGIS